MIFTGRFSVANNDIPICHKVWSVLGKDFAAWRARCTDGDNQSHLQYCETEKGYLEDRRLMHKQTCFYEGDQNDFYSC